MNIEPKIEIRSDEDTIGQFIVEPLEQGMGNTLGNALRRLLLSGIEGAAVTSICIHKKDPSDKECPYVEHEFKPIPGVKEDVTDLMLNLRNMYVKLADNVESGVIKIDVQGKGEVTGDRTECSEGVEVVNKDVYLCFITDEDAEFKIDMTVERGKGYRLPEKQLEHNVPDKIGIIPVASVFSPIVKVGYSVDPCRVGQNTNFERLVIDITTNGTVKASDALRSACEQLIVMFTMIGSCAGQLNIAGLHFGPMDKAASKEQMLDRSVETLQFSHRTKNCLARENIKTVRELTKYSESELLKIKSFGKVSLDEVKLKLEELGFEIKK